MGDHRTSIVIAPCFGTLALAAACGSDADQFKFYSPDREPPVVAAPTATSGGSGGTSAGGTGGSQAGSGGAGGIDGGEPDQDSGEAAPDQTAEGGPEADAAPPCSQDPEAASNDTMNLATYLGEIDDCADYQSPDLHGVLRDGSDVDWYVYRGIDGWNPLCGIEAMIKLNALVDLQVCGYVDREAGPPSTVTCSVGDPSTESGLPGCCANGKAIEMDLQYDQVSAIPTDTAKIFIRVSGDPSLEACTHYDLTYKF